MEVARVTAETISHYVVLSFLFHRHTTPKLSVDSPEFKPLNQNNGDNEANTYSKPEAYGNNYIQPNFYPSYNQEIPPTDQGFAGGYDYYEPQMAQQDGFEQDYLSLGVDNLNIHKQLDNYFYSNQRYQRFAAPYLPLQHHLYTSPPPHISNLNPQLQPYHYFYINEGLREELLEKSEARQRVLPANDPESLSLPQQVHMYHTLYPIGLESERTSKIFGLQTSLYKAIRATDGKHYCLRRIENYRLNNEMSIACVEHWRQIQNAGIVSVREGFTTKAFGDISLVVVYDYHPLAVTLHSKYLSKPDMNHFSGVKEEILWSIICQITSAIKIVHSSNLAVRVIEASKILITGQNRQNDVLEDNLGRELENGRLVRLLCKLGHINERPEFEKDSTWAETGDRYLLKLFRDYVFHQVSENGEPIIDMAHVLSCLNKSSMYHSQLMAIKDQNRPFIEKLLADKVQSLLVQDLPAELNLGTFGRTFGNNFGFTGLPAFGGIHQFGNPYGYNPFGAIPLMINCQ
ncbi:PAB-dependent poly(A)-specific ribonuclease subunit 3 [Boothiomyces sp. JEL0866]|nr:PAB-dependent poly(A)-specific ribonuclease subunit 3 [Boothiomyces sp. JEL0866]